MADPLVPTVVVPDPGKNNAEVAEKLVNQGRLDAPSNPQDRLDASSALDALAEAKNKVVDDPAVVDPPVVAPVDDEAAKKAAAEAEKAAADRAKSLEKAETFFKDAPGLPPNASPKSADAFAAIKIRAEQEISTRETKIEELNKQLTEAQEKLKNPIPAETENELKELREWRAKLDVDADPKFQEFDKQISTSQEFIYSQLKKSPAISDAVIEEIKKHGGPENVKMEKIFDAVKDPTIQRLVESKIADIEMAKFNKEQTIKSAKENIGQYLSQRQEANVKAATAHTTATREQLGQLTAKLPWFAKQKAADNADENGKKAVEQHNSFIENLTENVEAALKDGSPEMRAILITGMASLLHLQPQHDAALAKIASLEKQLKEATETVDRFKKASVSRTREGGAPPSGQLPQPKTDQGKLIGTPATQALDDIAKQIFEARQAAGK